MSLEIVACVIAGVAVVGSAAAGIYYSRERRDASGMNPSSTGIVLRDHGWLFGLAKLRRLRGELRHEAQVRRDVSDYRKGCAPGAVGDLDKLLREVEPETKEPRR